MESWVMPLAAAVFAIAGFFAYKTTDETFRKKRGFLFVLMIFGYACSFAISFPILTIVLIVRHLKK